MLFVNLPFVDLNFKAGPFVGFFPLNKTCYYTWAAVEVRNLFVHYRVDITIKA